MDSTLDDLTLAIPPFHLGAPRVLRGFPSPIHFGPMPKKPYTYSECVICRKPASTRSRYCSAHKSRLNRYGDPEAKPMPMIGKNNAFALELKIARRYMQMHAENPAVAAAVELAKAMLAYRSQTPLSSDVRLQEALNCQLSSGAPPAEVVARVVALYLISKRRPFKSQRMETITLGRLVLHTVPNGKARWGAQVYHHAGELAMRHLGPFAASLITRVERDAERVNDLVQQSKVPL